MTLKKPVSTGLNLIGLALLLSACGSGSSSSSTPQPDEQSGTIYGQLQKITASSVRPMTQIVEGPEFNAVVNATQQFNLNLPAANVVESKYSADFIDLKDIFVGCTVTPTTDVKLIPLNSLQTQDGQELKSFSFSNNTKIYHYWWFANKAATTTIEGQCLAGKFNQQSLNLRGGWNMVNWSTDGNLTMLQVQAPESNRFSWSPTSIDGQQVETDADLPLDKLEHHRTR